MLNTNIHIKLKRFSTTLHLAWPCPRTADKSQQYCTRQRNDKTFKGGTPTLNQTRWQEHSFKSFVKASECRLAWDRDDNIDVVVGVFLLDSSGELRAHVKPSCSTPHKVTRAYINTSKPNCLLGLIRFSPGNNHIKCMVSTKYLHSLITVDGVDHPRLV